MWIEPALEPFEPGEGEDLQEDPEWDKDDWMDYADCLRHECV